MSDRVRITGRSDSGMDVSPQFAPYTKVIMTVGEGENQGVYVAGYDGGRVLELENPWGSQQIANHIFSQIRGYQYQPYSMEGAFLDPAVELGDEIETDSFQSVIARQDIRFGNLMPSDISAPGAEELHEYPYLSQEQRRIQRVAGALTEFTIEQGRINAELRSADLLSSAKLIMTANGLRGEFQQADAGLQSKLELTAGFLGLDFAHTETWGTLEARLEASANGISESLKQKIKTYYQASPPVEDGGVTEGSIWYCSADYPAQGTPQYLRGRMYRWSVTDAQTDPPTMGWQSCEDYALAQSITSTIEAEILGNAEGEGPDAADSLIMRLINKLERTGIKTESTIEADFFGVAGADGYTRKVSRIEQTADGLSILVTGRNMDGESDTTSFQIGSSFFNSIITHTDANHAASLSSQISQTNSKISFLVSGDGTSGSQFAVTSNFIQAVTDNFEVLGRMSIVDPNGENQTTITGNFAATGNVTARHILVAPESASNLYGYFEADTSNGIRNAIDFRSRFFTMRGDDNRAGMLISSFNNIAVRISDGVITAESRSGLDESKRILENGASVLNPNRYRRMDDTVLGTVVGEIDLDASVSTPVVSSSGIIRSGFADTWYSSSESGNGIRISTNFLDLDLDRIRMSCYAHKNNNSAGDVEHIGYDYPLSVGFTVTIPESNLHGTGIGSSNIMDDVDPFEEIIIPIFSSVPQNAYADYFEEITVPYYNYTPNGTNGTTPTGYKTVKVLRGGADTPVLSGYKSVKVLRGSAQPKISAVRNGLVLSDASRTYRYFHPGKSTTIRDLDGHSFTESNNLGANWNDGNRTTPTYRY